MCSTGRVSCKLPQQTSRVVRTSPLRVFFASQCLGSGSSSRPLKRVPVDFRSNRNGFFFFRFSGRAHPKPCHLQMVCLVFPFSTSLLMAKGSELPTIPVRGPKRRNGSCDTSDISRHLRTRSQAEEHSRGTFFAGLCELPNSERTPAPMNDSDLQTPHLALCFWRTKGYTRVVYIARHRCSLH